MWTVKQGGGAEKNARAGNTKEKQNTKILAAAKLSKVESGRNNDKASIVKNCAKWSAIWRPETMFVD
ncbi:hypothetical protein GQ600_1025 [Phytophthora cactorum]|nr:hypothetical protein GQ600_1025 [Phytophthora cactorum]